MKTSCAALLTCALGLSLHLQSAGFIAEAGPIPKVRKDLAVEDLGCPVRTLRVDGRMVVKIPTTGQWHFCAFLTALNRTHIVTDPPMLFYDLNLESGKANLAVGVRGRSTLDRTVAHSNGKIYVGTGRPCNLMEYDPKTGEARLIGSLTDDYYREVVCMVEGSDGVLSIGIRRTAAAQYNPKTGRLERFDKISPNGTVYSVASDGRFLYACLGSHPWRLVVHDLQTGEQKVRLQSGKGEKHTRSRVIMATNGNLYYLRGRDQVYLLEQGEPSLVAGSPQIKEIRRGNLYSLREAFDELGMVIDVSRTLPTGWNNGEMTVRWRNRDAKDWRSSTMHVEELRNTAVKILAPLPSGKLIGYASHYVPFIVPDPKTFWPARHITAYGPFFRFDPETRESVLLGASPGPIYDMATFGGRTYLTGRGSLFAVYDPAQPWSYSHLKSGAAEPTNPRALSLKPKAITNHFMVEGADDRVYFAQKGRRGGGLAWYDPKTGQSGGWQDRFVRRKVNDLVAVNGGRLIVVSTSASAKGKLFVLDVKTGQWVGELRPFENEIAAGRLMAAGPDHVVGVIRHPFAGNAEPESCSSRIYKCNVRSGKVEAQKHYRGKAFAGMSGFDLKPDESRLAVGPDRCGWMFVGRTLCRVRPDTAELEKIMECDFAGRMLFVGNDLYLYNGGRLFFDEFASIKRIQNIFE